MRISFFNIIRKIIFINFEQSDVIIQKINKMSQYRHPDRLRLEK